MKGEKIVLTKSDSAAQLKGGEGPAQKHHYVPLGLVADVEVETRQVRLSATGANAVLFEEEGAD